MMTDGGTGRVHQRHQELESAERQQDQKALAAEFRKWCQPLGSPLILWCARGLRRFEAAGLSRPCWVAGAWTLMQANCCLGSEMLESVLFADPWPAFMAVT